MQTFLPYPSFYSSAACLDRARLGKQRLEAYDIYGILTDFEHTNHNEKQKAFLPKRYGNHPATLMWKNYEDLLAQYGLIISEEWVKRGYNDMYVPLFTDLVYRSKGYIDSPPWLGYGHFHSSHKSALLFKDYEHYSKFLWEEEPAVPDSKNSLPYFWPTKEGVM